MFREILKEYIEKPKREVPLDLNVLLPGDRHYYLLMSGDSWYVIVDADYFRLDNFTINEIEGSFPVKVEEWCVRVKYHEPLGTATLSLEELSRLEEDPTINPSEYTLLKGYYSQALAKVVPMKGVTLNSFDLSFFHREDDTDHPVADTPLSSNDLPAHFLDNFSPSFARVISALHQHGFNIPRAYQGIPSFEPGYNLFDELGDPSIHVAAHSPKIEEFKATIPGSPEHTKFTNQVIRANLKEQARLWRLVEDFYKDRPPISPEARLIVSSIHLAESFLRPHGGDIRFVQDKEIQAQWYQNMRDEFEAFGEFLIRN